MKPESNKTSSGDVSLLRDFIKLKALWPYLRQDRRLLTVSVLLIPLIAFLQAIVPYVIKQAIDKGVMQKDYSYLSYMAGIYLVVVVCEYLSRTSQTFVTSLSVLRMIKRMRNALTRHVLKLNCKFHDQNLSGVLATRATSDFDNLSESLNQGILESAVDFSVLIGCLIGMFLLSPQLTLASCLFVPLVIFIVNNFSRRIKRSLLGARKKIAALNGFTQECLNGASAIKLLNGEHEAAKKFDQLNIDYRNTQMEAVVYDALIYSIIDGITWIVIGVVLWLIVANVFNVNDITPGVAVAFVQYLRNFFEPIKNLSNKIAMLQGAFTALDRVSGLFNVKEFIAGDKDIASLKGSINFNHVSYRYQTKDQSLENLVLHDMSFSIAPGESVALVGPTGSGKSTIIKLLSKLYEGYEGEISVDGLELKNIAPDSLLKKISIVPQDIVIFEGSVAFNIVLGNPDIHESDFINAAKLVGADKFIEELPGKYDFILREHGQNLSYGQRQLICFARAVAKNPSLLILDEATSSIDLASEQLVQDAIKSIVKNRTVIIIAHRLSTIKECDKILVINNGVLAEQGTHASLLGLGGIYTRMSQALV